MDEQLFAVSGFAKQGWRSPDEASVSTGVITTGIDKTPCIDIETEDNEAWNMVSLPVEEARKLFTRGLEMCDFLDKKERKVKDGQAR